MPGNDRRIVAEGLADRETLSGAPPRFMPGVVAVVATLAFLFWLSLPCRMPYLGKVSENVFFSANINVLIAVDNFREEGFWACRGAVLSLLPSVECPRYDQRGPYASYPPGPSYLTYAITLLTGHPASLELLAWLSLAYHLVMIMATAMTVFMLWPSGVPCRNLLSLLAGMGVLLQPVGMVWMSQLHFGEVAGVSLLSVLVFLEAWRSRYGTGAWLARLQILVLVAGSLMHWIFVPAAFVLFWLRLVEAGWRQWRSAWWNAMKTTLLPVTAVMVALIVHLSALGVVGRFVEKGLHRANMHSSETDYWHTREYIQIHFRMGKSVLGAAWWHVLNWYGNAGAALLVVTLTTVLFLYVLSVLRRTRGCAGKQDFFRHRLRPLALGACAAVGTWLLLRQHVAIHPFGTLYWLSLYGLAWGIVPMLAYGCAAAQPRLASICSSRAGHGVFILICLGWFSLGTYMTAHHLARGGGGYMPPFFALEQTCRAIAKHTEYRDVLFSPDTDFGLVATDRVGSQAKYLAGKFAYPVKTPEDFLRQVAAFELPSGARVNLLFASAPAPEWSEVLRGATLIPVGSHRLYRLPRNIP